MKLGNLTLAYEALQALFRADLPVKTAYALSKVISPITEELNELEGMRQHLLLKHKGSKEGFIEEYNTLLEEDVKLDLPSIPIREVLESNAKIPPIGIHILLSVGILTED